MSAPIGQKIKKISYLSAIIIVVASTIGAGIFFKNGQLFQLAHGNLWLVLLSWTIAGFGMIALGLSIIELSSAQTSNRGIFEWTKKFAGPKFHQMAVNYNKWIFMPAILFTMPIYFIMAIDDALSVQSVFDDAGALIETSQLPGIWVLVAAIGVFVWFMLWNLLPIKYAAGFQWFSMIMKFFPLIIVPIFGFMNMGDLTFAAIDEAREVSVEGYKGINGIGPAMILLAGFPAITFAYDGIHNATSIKSEMKDPNKVGSATIIGIIIITVIYLFVTLAFGLGSTSGTIFGIDKLWNTTGGWITVNIFISIGILGIVNGFLTGFIYQFADQMTQPGEAEEMNWIKKKLFKSDSQVDDKRQRVLAAWTFIFALTFTVMLVLGLIGLYGFANGYGTDYADANAGALYAFTDTVVNYTSLMFYLIIAVAAAGGIRNRKTNKVAVDKKPYFLPAAWVTVIMFLGFGFWMLFSGFIDTVSGINWDGGLPEGDLAEGWTKAKFQINSMIKLLIIVAALAISIIPVLINKDKYTDSGSASQPKEAQPLMSAAAPAPAPEETTAPAEESTEA